MSLISGNENKIFAKGVIGNVRKAQEDSHGYKLNTPNGDLFVVCDGMGGHVGGATASRIAVDSIIEHIDREKYVSPIEALDGALQFANMQILGHADAHPELKGMGTTACIVLIQGDDVWIAHVGDSRIYLYLGNEKQLHRITKDHSYVQTLVDAGEITDEEAEHHPNKNRILKALGVTPDLHPTFNHERRAIHPKNGDIFVICSDGLCGMIPDSTIERTLAENLTLHEKGEKLIELAMIGEIVVPGGQDNCTLELIEIDNSNWNQSDFRSFNPNRRPKPAITQDEIPTEVPQTNKETGIQSVAIRKKDNKIIKKIVAAAVALILIAVAAWWLATASQNSKCKKAKASVEQAEKKVKNAEENLENARKEKKGEKAISELSNILDAEKKELADANSNYNSCGCDKNK